jgi:DNA anti-recombination protein RmuC
MIAESYVIGSVCAAVGAALNSVLRYVRGTRHDAAVIVLQGWIRISKEQSEFREQLRLEIAGLRDELATVRAENAALVKEMAQLKKQNLELTVENEQLEERVRELEAESRTR